MRYNHIQCALFCTALTVRYVRCRTHFVLTDGDADAEEVRHIAEDAPYTPEGHTSLDALGYTTHNEHSPRRGSRHPTQFENLSSMTHEGMTLLQVEKQLRMRHVLDGLPQASVALLVKRHVSHMTLQAIAEEEGVTPQAVAKRLETANRDFKVSFAERWLDPLDTTLLLSDGGLEDE